MRRGWIPLLLFAIGCGGDAFDGTFEATYQGVPATFKLEEEDGRISGTVSFGGAEGTIEGKVNDEKAKGEVTVPQNGLAMPFEATARGDDRIDWVYKIQNPLTGGTQEVALTLRRRADGDEREASGSFSLDPRLIGTWFADVSGGRISDNRVTTRITNTLRADGTFVYGGGSSLITLHDRAGDAGATADVGGGGSVTGRWKTEGSILYGRFGQSGQWTPLGRYSVSGNDTVLYAPDGGKQLWSRQ